MSAGVSVRNTHDQLREEYFFQPWRIHMGEVVQFVPKRELERARLIREARAIYESIFPTAARASVQQDS